MSTYIPEGAFRLDRSRNATIQIAEDIRARIVTLEIRPGAQLPRAALSAYYNVSITPLREALLRLQDAGLVDIFPQHVTRVRRIDLRSAREALFAQRALELECAQTVAEKAHAGIAGVLAAQADALHAAGAGGDLEALLSAVRRCQAALFDGALATGCWTRLRALGGNLDRLWRLYPPDAGAAAGHYRRLAGAIGSGDAAAARAAVRARLAPIGDTIAALLAAHPRGELPEGQPPARP